MVTPQSIPVKTISPDSRLKKVVDTPDLSARRVQVNEVNIKLTTPVKLNVHRESAKSFATKSKADDSPIVNGF